MHQKGDTYKNKFSPKDTRYSLQTGNTWVHQKKIKDLRLHNYAKLISTPFKSSLISLFPNDPYWSYRNNIPHLVPSSIFPHYRRVSLLLITE